MQVPVNKTGGKIAALAIDDLGSLIRTDGIVATIVEHTDDHAILDGNATGRHTLAIHVDDLRIGKQRVDGHATLGGLDHRPHDLNGHTYSFNRRKKLRSGQAFTAASQQPLYAQTMGQQYGPPLNGIRHLVQWRQVALHQ